MVQQKEVSQQCGEENSRQSVPLLETEEEPNTDKTETRRMGCSESVELTPRMRHWSGWVPTSPSAPDYPPLKRSFVIHPAVSSVDSDSELQSSPNLPSSDLVQSFLEGLPVTTPNRAPQGGQ